MSRPVWPHLHDYSGSASMSMPPDYNPFAYAPPIRCEPKAEAVYRPEGTWRGLDGGVKIGEAE